ncbi:hypothetical protein H5410_056759, partial [Solanum commersonii]
SHVHGFGRAPSHPILRDPKSACASVVRAKSSTGREKRIKQPSDPNKATNDVPTQSKSSKIGSCRGPMENIQEMQNNEKRKMAQLITAEWRRVLTGSLLAHRFPEHSPAVFNASQAVTGWLETRRHIPRHHRHRSVSTVPPGHSGPLIQMEFDYDGTLCGVVPSGIPERRGGYIGWPNICRRWRSSAEWVAAPRQHRRLTLTLWRISSKKVEIDFARYGREIHERALDLHYFFHALFCLCAGRTLECRPHGQSPPNSVGHRSHLAMRLNVADCRERACEVPHSYDPCISSCALAMTSRRDHTDTIPCSSGQHGPSSSSRPPQLAGSMATLLHHIQRCKVVTSPRLSEDGGYDEPGEEYGIQPSAEHYACVVNMIGRLGWLDEAHNFSKQLGVEGNVLGRWGSLLAACRSIDNIRRGMRKKGLSKEIGCSLIDTSGYPHCFVSKDKKHPQYYMIYDMLGYLTINMKDAGYKPKLELIEEWIYALEE